MAEPTILFFELNSGDFLQTKIFKLQKGWILRFVLGKGVYGEKVRLVVHPGKREFIFEEPASLEDLDSFVDYRCDDFGSFRYEFYLEESETPSGNGYFHVLPEWNISGGKRISLNSLSCITHLSKLLGPLEEWKSRLAVAHEAGYNMVHLTPIQELGISNSSYSIADYHKVNPMFGEVGFEDVKKVIKDLEDEWGMLTIQDVVWNHAARNSQWLQEHPECAYNCQNAPHLRPAYILDRALVHFSRKISKGDYESKGLPSSISTGEHIGALQYILRTEILPDLKLHEFFQLNVDGVIEELKKSLDNNDFDDLDDGKTNIELVQDREFRRKQCSVDMAGAKRALLTKLAYNRGDPAMEEMVLAELKIELENINSNVEKEFQNTIEAIINAVSGHVCYERVESNGPKIDEINDSQPLVTNYFLHPFETNSIFEDEFYVFDSEKSKFLMACNGWVMNHDPLNNFAEYPSMTYLRRELVCWGDCIKLNYGNCPEDCPYLWDYMTKYTENCAKIFHGFRIDNCHSTPIHVAEFLLSKARKIRSDLYVVAELFTGSESIDHIFVNRLGITSLIREAQNAPDSHEQGRFVYRYGGDPVGAFKSKNIRIIPSTVAHALFFDQTHDNPPPKIKRTMYDYVPTAAMTTVAYCASGSTRGYDEFVNEKIDVVKEKKLYNTLENLKNYGLIKARKIFNDLKFYLCENGFNEIFVDQVNPNIVAVTRHNPENHESFLIVSHCGFNEFNWIPNCRNLNISDDISEIIFEIKTIEFENSNFGVEIFKNVQFEKSKMVKIENNNISFTGFPTGSVIAFKITPKKSTVEACGKIKSIISNDEVKNELKKALESLSLQKLNYVLFRCEKEDQSEFGEGAYELPHVGKFVYCGLEGIYPVIKKIQQTNDLGHPLCSNLRDGDWLCDYICRRLGRMNELSKIKEIFEKCLNLLKDVPHFLKPCYFELIFTYLRKATVEVALQKLNFESFAGTNLSRHLALNSIAFLADISSARLPPIIEPNLEEGDKEPSSLSAGLPHFSEGIWRNWGRDTFIALPGILISTGRFKDARNIILAFGGALRHGLIPNLLGEGKCSRYNCRDAVWFWLAGIMRYIQKVPQGEEILKDKVNRLYPEDDLDYGSKEEYLYETMNEALQRHFKKISFREKNAGYMIDEHMKNEGFNIEIKINYETGFVEGGNKWNCGTWMDKMGSSEKAGNKGIPATPRNGAPVELQGLAIFVAENLQKLYENNIYPYDGLINEEEKIHWSWKDWSLRLRTNFRKYFFIRDDDDSKFVFRKGIIKDTVGASDGFPDYQLRPNFGICLALVPDILPFEEAWSALMTASEVLLSCLGMKTLDPEDWAFNGFYNNNDNGENKITANGWNYHQGPEWIWIAAVFLKAILKVGKCKKLSIIKKHLYYFKKYVEDSNWRSLPELTNLNGDFCEASCPAQAWSVGCAIEAIETLKEVL